MIPQLPVEQRSEIQSIPERDSIYFLGQRKCGLIVI